MVCRESGEFLPGSHITLIFKPADALTERLGRATCRSVRRPCTRVAKTGRPVQTLVAYPVRSDPGGKGAAALRAERGVDEPDPTPTRRAEGVVRGKTDGAVEAAPRIQHGECRPGRGTEPVQPHRSVTLLRAFDCPSPLHMKISGSGSVCLFPLTPALSLQGRGSRLSLPPAEDVCCRLHYSAPPRSPAPCLSAPGGRECGLPARKGKNSGQDARAPRQQEGERPEAGAAGPVPGGLRHNVQHTFQGRGSRLSLPPLQGGGALPLSGQERCETEPLSNFWCWLHLPPTEWLRFNPNAATHKEMQPLAVKCSQHRSLE